MLGIRGVYPLMRALPFTNVESLDLSGNPLDLPSAWAIAFTLGQESGLKRLALDGTSLASRGAAAGHIAVALLSNCHSALEHLSGPPLAAALAGLGVAVPPAWQPDPPPAAWGMTGGPALAGGGFVAPSNATVCAPDRPPPSPPAQHNFPLFWPGHAYAVGPPKH